MPETITFLLKANLSLVLFYLGYRMLLRKLTFYQLNRFYLLFGLAFSATYPVVDISGWMAVQQPFAAEVVYVVPDWQHMPAAEFDGWPLVLALFWLGVTYFAVQLLIRLTSLWQIHRTSRPATWRLFRYRQVFANVNPFTFWRNIYVNIQQHEAAELEAIFSHEQIHANELHTVDVLLAELFRVLCWFNPGAWLMRHAIHENLEYITDRSVLRSGVDKKTYQYRLLKMGQYAASHPQVANHFNFKSLKRRIAMMNRKRSSVLQLGNYVFAIPAIAGMVLAFTMTHAYQHDGAETANQLDLPLLAEVQRPLSTDTNIRNEVESEVTLQPGPEQPNEVRVARPLVIEVRQPEDVTKEADRGPTIRHIDTAQAGPLYVVDGIPIRTEGLLHKIKPEDIARISVWKDERLATSLYGSDASDGLVVLTTKAAELMADTIIIGNGRDTVTARVRDRLAATLRGYQSALHGYQSALHDYQSIIRSYQAVIGDQQEKPAGQQAPGLAAATPINRLFFQGKQQPDFNGALIIIDGKESTATVLRALSPDRIESINVLKGEAATKAHGQKGANGAIEVITER